MADDFDEAAIKAEEDAAKKQADALLAEVSKERRHTDRLRLKDHNETRDRRRRSHSRERDRYAVLVQADSVQAFLGYLLYCSWFLINLLMTCCVVFTASNV